LEKVVYIKPSFSRKAGSTELTDISVCAENGGEKGVLSIL